MIPYKTLEELEAYLIEHDTRTVDKLIIEDDTSPLGASMQESDKLENPDSEMHLSEARIAGGVPRRKPRRVMAKEVIDKRTVTKSGAVYVWNEKLKAYVRRK